MSQRMSRREMRKAGLLKPRPAAESQDPAVDEPDFDDVGTQQMSALEHDETAGSPAVPATPSTPDEALAEADKPEAEPHDISSVATPDEASADSDPETAVPDSEAELGDSVEVEPPSPVGAESAEEGQADESPVSQASPERTSVFDRFASNDDASPASDSADTDEAVATPAVKPEDADGPSFESDDDDDFAGALRAKLKSTPPAETADDSEVDDRDYAESPSRWKTAVLFLLLIIVGFGVGILLGSLIFSNGSAEAAAHSTILTTHLSHYYPGAL